MADINKLQRWASRKLFNDALQQINPSTIRNALQNQLDPADRQRLVDRVKSNDANSVGFIIIDAVRSEVQASALSNAEALFGGDSITLDELESLLD